MIYDSRLGRCECAIPWVRWFWISSGEKRVPLCSSGCMRNLRYFHQEYLLLMSDIPPASRGTVTAENSWEVMTKIMARLFQSDGVSIHVFWSWALVNYFNFLNLGMVKRGSSLRCIRPSCWLCQSPIRTSHQHISDLYLKDRGSTLIIDAEGVQDLDFTRKRGINVNCQRVVTVFDILSPLIEIKYQYDVIKQSLLSSQIGMTYSILAHCCRDIRID